MVKKNKGSSIIEFTLLVPILFGCIYFYVLSMLFIVEHGKMADTLSKQLYESEESALEAINNNGSHESKEGGTEVVNYKGDYEKYDIVLEFKKNANDTVKCLRRWQFVADTVR